MFLRVLEDEISLDISLILTIHHKKAVLPSQTIVGENNLNLPNVEAKATIST